MSNVQVIVTVQDENTVRLRHERGSEVSGTTTKDQLTRDTVEVLVRWLKEGQLQTTQEFKVLGSHLFQLLFNGEVKNFFITLIKEAKNKDEPMSLQLSFQEQAANLSTLPWEYLYYSGSEVMRGFFLATDLKLAISHFLLPPDGFTSSEGEADTLKILLVISRPRDEDRIDADSVIEALEKLREANNIDIDILDTPTVERFVEKVECFKPHILHFLGHGQVDKDGAGQIALLNPDEKTAAWCNFYTVAEYFRSITPIPPLVFLHMNQDASAEFTSTLRNLAIELIQVGIQAVVTMQYPISNEVVIRFCRKFYPELARGDFIDSAVQKGRFEIIRIEAKRYTNRFFGTPALYMRSRDRIIHSVGKGGRPVGGLRGIQQDNLTAEQGPSAVAAAGESSRSRLG